MGLTNRRIAIISDPHIGEPSNFFRRVTGHHDISNGEALLYIIERLNEHPEDFPLLILGDITDRSTEREAAEARRILRKYEGELFLVLGNHDETTPWKMGMGYDRRGHYRMLELAEEFNGERGFPIVRDFPDYRLILIDSNAHNEKGTAFARGKIGNMQLSFLAANLANTKPNIVAMHHYPEDLNTTLAVSDADDLLYICSRFPTTIVNGHRHREGEYAPTQKRPRILTHGKCVDTRRVRILDPKTGLFEFLEF